MSAKKTRAPTSNPAFNIPMTDEQWDVVDFIGFEAETAFIYPFATDFDDITMETVDCIVERCNGYTNDTDTLYEICEKVLGINAEVYQRRNK